MIIEHALRYVSEMKNKTVLLQKINRVKLYKRLYLPFELVNIDGDRLTNAYYNLEE